MRACVQRVSKAHVTVDGVETGRIGRGLVVLLGIGHSDGRKRFGNIQRYDPIAVCVCSVRCLYRLAYLCEQSCHSWSGHRHDSDHSYNYRC